MYMDFNHITSPIHPQSPPPFLPAPSPPLAAECAPAAEDDEVQVKGPLDNVLAQARDLAEEYAAKTRELPGIKHTIDMFQKGIDLVGPYARILQDQMIHMWK